MRYIYLFVYFIFFFSCSYENKTLKEEFEFEDINLHLDTTIISTIKIYMKEFDTFDVINLYCKSMPKRDNIILLTASTLANISKDKAIPSLYFKVHDTPILLHYNKLKLDMGQDRLRYTQFIKVYSKKFSTDFLLYDPPCWILVLSKDKIHVYKSIEEYHEKVGVYEPTVPFW